MRYKIMKEHIENGKVVFEELIATTLNKADAKFIVENLRRGNNNQTFYYKEEK